MDAVHKDVAQLLRSPATVRTFRAMMWGYLFFLPSVGTYLDAVGWLLLLTAVHLTRPARTPLQVWVAAAGLAASVARVAIFRFPGQPPVSYTLLYQFSLALSALMLWLQCDTAVALADAAGSRAVRAQALTRRWLYVLQAAFPAIVLVTAPWLPTGMGGIALSVGILLASVVITTFVLAFLANVAKMCVAAAADDEGRSAT